MPILGTIASSIAKSSAVLAYESIATATGGSSSVTFNSIPQTYTHLQIRGFEYCTGTGGAGPAEWYVWFNNDTNGANYYKIRFFGYNSNNQLAQNGTVGGEGIWGTQDTRSGGMLGVSGWTLDIHNYTASQYKTVVARGVGGSSSTGLSVGIAGGPWMSGSAITRVDIGCNQGNFASGSRIALYGIK